MVHAVGTDVKDLCEYIMVLMSRYSQQWSGEQEGEFRKQLRAMAEKAAVPIERPSAEGQGWRNWYEFERWRW